MGPVAAAPWAVKACISKLAPRNAKPQTVPGGVDSVVPFVRMAREGRSCDAGQLNPPTTGCDGSQPSTRAAAFVIGEKGSPNNKHALLALSNRSVSRCCRGSSRSPDNVKGAISEPSGRFPAAMATQGCNSLSLPPPMTPAPTTPTSVCALVLSKASSTMVSKYLSSGNPTVTMARSGAGAVPRSRASSVSASSTPFFQSLELLLIVVLNDGASAVAAAITARKRGMLPLDVFYGCVGSCLTLAVQEHRVLCCGSVGDS